MKGRNFVGNLLLLIFKGELLLEHPIKALESDIIHPSNLNLQFKSPLSLEPSPRRLSPPKSKFLSAKKLEIAQIEPSVFSQNKEANRSPIEQVYACSRSTVIDCVSSIMSMRKLLPREPETIFDF